MRAGSSLAGYTVLERVGTGETGEVYRARDEGSGAEVAVKVLAAAIASDGERMRRLRADVEALAASAHPYLIHLSAVDESGPAPCLVMEFLKGWRLDGLIPGRGTSVTRFFEIALPVVDAVIALHEAGITHGDLRPAQVMMTNDGLVKVTGFALRRLPEDEPAADIPALGALFFRMLAGSRPSATARPVPAALGGLRPELPEALRRVVDACLDPDPARRPSSVADVRRDLLRVRRELEIPGEAGGPSLAVIPFTDLSPGKDQDYYCDGLTEELIGRLAGAPQLQVASREQVFQFKDSSLPTREIGRRLGVNRVLEGTARKTNGKLRVSVELLGLPDGRSLWSADYDRRTEDVFEIQDDIVRSLRTVLTPGEGDPAPSPATTNVQAYEYYLRGKKFYNQYRKRGIELALQMFSTAIAEDPEYSLAHAGIADCCCYLYLYAEGHQERLRQALAASERALALNANLAAVQASRGLALSIAGRHDEADEAFETALRLNPRHFEAHYYYARDCFAQGRMEEAARLFERASEVNPHDYQSPLLIAQVYERLGRPEEAESARRRGVRIAEHQIKLHPGDVRARYMGANGLAALGEPTRALEWANLAQVMEPRDPMVLYNVGCIYALCGKHDEAVEALEKAARGGLAQKGWYENDSNLDPLRSLGRFRALMGWLDEHGST